MRIGSHEKLWALCCALQLCWAAPSQAACVNSLTGDYSAYQKAATDCGLSPISDMDWRNPEKQKNALRDLRLKSDAYQAANPPAAPPAAVIGPALDANNPYEQEARAMDEQSISGHAFTKSAQFGLRGSGHLDAAGAKDQAQQLSETSRALNVNGQIAQVSTYTGYATAAASVGALVIGNTTNNTTMESIADVAAKASIGVGAVNLSTGAYGYFKAAEYKDTGIASINRMQAGLDRNKPEDEAKFRRLETAREQFKKAQVEANDAAIGMAVRGAADIAVGVGTMALEKKITNEKQNMGSLEGDTTRTSTSVNNTQNGANGGGNTGSGGGTTAYNGGINSGTTSGNAANGGTSGGILGGSEGGVGSAGTQTSSGGGTTVAALASPGASIAPNSPRGQSLQGNSNASSGGGGSGAIASVSGGGKNSALGGGEEPPAEDKETPQEIAENTESGSEGYSGGGSGGKGGYHLSSDAPDENNPFASVFGQIGQMVKGATDSGADGAKNGGSFRAPASREAAAATQNIVLGAEQNLFEAHRAKMFLMKFRGNL